MERVWGRRAGGKLSPGCHGALFSRERDGAHGYLGSWIFQSLFLPHCFSLIKSQTTEPGSVIPGFIGVDGLNGAFLV